MDFHGWILLLTLVVAITYLTVSVFVLLGYGIKKDYQRWRKMNRRNRDSSTPDEKGTDHEER